MISIICPTYNEEKYISRCIESMIAQDYPLQDMELLLIDGQSTDNTRKIIQPFANNYSFIKLLDNPDKVVPHALNRGICEAKGNVIIRIDAHCVYPSNYISSLVKYLYELNADNVGGVWNTLPANDSTTCRAIAIASSHPFGVGNSKHKTGSKKIIETDTVPFGCYRRDVFEKIGMFDEELIRNQDDELNGRLINSEGKIYLIPDIVINYIARDSIEKMSKMYYQYGLFKPLVNKKLRKPATIRQFFPAMFLSGLFWGGILSLFSFKIRLLYFFIIIIYWTIGIIVGIKSTNQYNDSKLIYYLPFTFFIIHLSYGWGYLEGYYKILFHKKITIRIDNR